MFSLPRVFILLAFTVLAILGHPSQAQETANNSQFPACAGHNQSVAVIIGDQIDEDDDGLNDFWETYWFNDLDEDAAGDPDGDGANNGIEEANGTYPVQMAGSGEDSRDTDGDGLWDGEEIALGTIGTTTDTDYDNFTDYEEVKGTCGYVTDPTNRDTDGDRLTEWQEVKGVYNHLPELYQTDPTKFDTDDDGLSDYEEIYGVDPLDSDADGLYDAWEMYWFGSLAPTGAEDPDGEGCDNECEEARGTCPVQAGCNAIDSRDTDGDGLDDYEEAFVYNTYGTKPDTDHDGLSDYEEVKGTRGFITDPNDPDTDNDGLTDFAETDGRYDHLTGFHPTNPLKPDTDDDGISDYDEIYGTLGVITDPTLADTDHDGLADNYEFTTLYEGGLKTDPTNPDTDGDGLTDGFEANTLYTGGFLTNPTNFDTDGDTLSDGFEVNTFSTWPWHIDTDDDGLPDGDEFLWGTYPKVMDSDGDRLTDGDEVWTHGTEPMMYDTDHDLVWDGDEIVCGTSPLLAETTPGTPDSWICGGSVMDSDGDALPDAWELAMFGHLVYGLRDDPDGDGLTNEIEKMLGTHANTWDSDGDGRSDGEEVFGSNGKPTSNPKLYDTDGDTLSDGQEVNLYGTNPNLMDTDSDTLSDPSEIFTHGTNPTKADTDDDGLSDPAEIATHLTNPTLADTDADGLNDGAEVNVYLTNPLLADTDADGLNDYAEIYTHNTDPKDADTDNDGLQDGEEVNVYGTNPKKTDTDDDTLSDGAEVEVHGTNPTKPDTDDDGLSDFDEIATHLTNPTLSDTDADGLSDYAEIYTHSTDPLLADTDIDGLNDGDEISCGTSPTVVNTFPPFSDADYCSGTASIELLTNGDFENGLSPDKSPVGWTIKKALGDKVKCDPLKVHSGNCAFKFRGGAAENTTLVQVIDLTGVTFHQGDHLALNAFFKGGNKAVRAKFILTIVYAGDALPSRKLVTVGPSTAYKKVSLPVAALISGEVQKITVMVKHRSLTGALWLDSMSLTLERGAGDAASIRGVPTPSSATETFRGSN